jgi:hypothetical protein
MHLGLCTSGELLPLSAPQPPENASIGMRAPSLNDISQCKGERHQISRPQ